MDQKISAIIENEHSLEVIIASLLAETVSRGNISVQGSPEQVKDTYGVSFINPETVQHSSRAPTQEPFMRDDFGWVIGFSFALPMFITLIVSVFIIGDIQSTADNILYSIWGLVIGSAIGLICATWVKHRHDRKIKKQEAKGGFVLWVNTNTQQQYEQVINILQKYDVKALESS